MPDPIWDIDETELLVRWGAMFPTPEALAWWRSEKARRAARTLEEIERDEKSDAEDAALHAKLGAWSAEYEEAMRSHFEPLRRLLDTIYPQAYWPHVGDPAFGGARWTLSPSQLQEVLTKTGTLRAGNVSRIRRIKRQRFLRIGTCSAVGVFTLIAVVRLVPLSVPSLLAVGCGFLVGYLAAGHDPQVVDLARAQRLPRPPAALEHLGQAALRGRQPEELVESRPPKVGGDQDDALVRLRENDREVGRGGGLAFRGHRRDDHDGMLGQDVLLEHLAGRVVEPEHGGV